MALPPRPWDTAELRALDSLVHEQYRRMLVRAQLDRAESGRAGRDTVLHELRTISRVVPTPATLAALGTAVRLTLWGAIAQEHGRDRSALDCASAWLSAAYAAASEPPTQFVLVPADSTLSALRDAALPLTEAEIDRLGLALADVTEAPVDWYRIAERVGRPAAACLAHVRRSMHITRGPLAPPEPSADAARQVYALVGPAWRQYARALGGALSADALRRSRLGAVRLRPASTARRDAVRRPRRPVAVSELLRNLQVCFLAAAAAGDAPLDVGAASIDVDEDDVARVVRELEDMTQKAAE
jgi:hypothetical protein